MERRCTGTMKLKGKEEDIHVTQLGKGVDGETCSFRNDSNISFKWAE